MKLEIGSILVKQFFFLNYANAHWIFRNRLIDLENDTVLLEGDFGWTSYHTYSEIYAWLDELLLQYPSVLTDYLVGSSFEGRQIRAVRLSRKEVRTYFQIRIQIKKLNLVQLKRKKNIGLQIGQSDNLCGIEHSCQRMDNVCYSYLAFK